MQFRRIRKPSTAMDMGPLLDCVLQLLIFFMLSSTFMTPKVTIALPEASTSDGSTDPDVVMVTVRGRDELYVNHEQVALERLEPVLRQRLEASQRKAVVFRGDQALPYQLFVSVMDAARRAGARSFDIAHTGSRPDVGDAHLPEESVAD